MVIIYTDRLDLTPFSAQLFNLDYLPAHNAARIHPYHSSVFIFPAWKEIYTNDDERTMSFDAARKFGEDVQKVYREYGYNLIEVPCISPMERMQFIKGHLKDEK